jgi:integrase
LTFLRAEDVKRFFEKHLSDLRPFILTPASARDFAAALEKRLKAEESQLSPKSLNHLRDGVYGIFEHARDYKVNLWRSENPIQWVKRRKVPKRRYETLRRDQIRLLLAALPVPKPEHQGIASPWRWAAAITLYTGARPGEVFGLHKSDVDLKAGVLTIQHPWEAPLPKNGRWRPVLIVPELRPYLDEMLKASPASSFCRGWTAVFTRTRSAGSSSTTCVVRW